MTTLMESIREINAGEFPRDARGILEMAADTVETHPDTWTIGETFRRSDGSPMAANPANAPYEESHFNEAGSACAVGWIQFLGHQAGRLARRRADQALQQAIPPPFQAHGVTGYNDQLEYPEQFVQWARRTVAMIDAEAEEKE